MSMWSPWRGCHRHSEGCKFCYIHKGDYKRGIDTDVIVKSEKFYAPIEKKKNGEYKMKSGLCYLCFQTDFLIEEADEWRKECWEMIRERSDITFLFLTKRIERFESVMPEDWGEGYDNVVVSCTVENQDRADFRLGIFDRLPIKHKNIVVQPMIEEVDLSGHLGGVEYVVAGGESDRNGRVLRYEWILKLRNQCIKSGVGFEFRQLGTHFIKDRRLYNIAVKDLCAQARKADINVKINKAVK